MSVFSSKLLGLPLTFLLLSSAAFSSAPIKSFSILPATAAQIELSMQKEADLKQRPASKSKLLRGIAATISAVGLSVMNQIPAFAGSVMFDNYTNDKLFGVVMQTKTSGGYSYTTHTTLKGLYAVEEMGERTINTQDGAEVWVGAVHSDDQPLKLNDSFRQSMKISADLCKRNGKGRNSDGSFNVYCNVNIVTNNNGRLSFKKERININSLDLNLAKWLNRGRNNGPSKSILLWKTQGGDLRIRVK